MQRLGDPTRHFWITIGVSRCLGVNLSDALQDGKLTHSGYADLVTRCRTCPHAKACEEWMGQQCGRATTPPPGCLNGAVFEALMAGQSPALQPEPA